MTTATIGKVFVEAYVAEQGYPVVGAFEDRKDLQKFYKELSDEQLAEWVAQAGLEHTPHESPVINRMRLCMTILYAHFPKEPSAKKESKYAKYSLEDLATMAMEHDVVFEDTDNERILRMRAIMALRAAKVLD